MDELDYRHSDVGEGLAQRSPPGPFMLTGMVTTALSRPAEVLALRMRKRLCHAHAG